MQYVQREMNAGASQSQIATRLMQRGVTMQQLQRVRSQYQALNGGTSSRSSGVSTDLLVQNKKRFPGAADHQFLGCPLFRRTQIPHGADHFRISKITSLFITYCSVDMICYAAHGCKPDIKHLSLSLET